MFKEGTKQQLWPKTITDMMLIMSENKWLFRGQKIGKATVWAKCHDGIY